MIDTTKNIQLFLGNCLEVMKEIPDKSVDLILCDLPYGTTTCKWDVIIPLDLLWSTYKNIIKDNTPIVLTAQTPFDKILGSSEIELLRYEWIWVKDVCSGFMNAKKMPLKQHENILVFYKKLPKYNPQDLIIHNKTIVQAKRTNKSVYGNMGILKKIGKAYTQEFTNYPKTLLYFANEKGLHPTQKPVELMKYLIKTYTNEGDLVLDNCMGSGTTGVACKELNRRFIGIELDENYMKIATERIKNTKLIESGD